MAWGGPPGPPGRLPPTWQQPVDEEEDEDVGGGVVSLDQIISVLKQHAPPGTEFDSWGAPKNRQVATWGRKRSLLVGINYIGQRGQLDGCINDVKTMQKFLDRQGFGRAEQRVLTDDNRSAMPTKKNIIESMKWLVHGAQPGDCFFFHYSGHGSQVPDVSGDEEDGMDETLVPVDFKSAGHILDDDVHDLLVLPLPKGAKLMAVCDCCHSGSVMDLPYVFTARTSLGGQRGLRMEEDSGVRSRGAPRGGPRRHRQRLGGRPVQSRVNKAVGEVVMFSGCSDDQTSADVGGNAGRRFDLPADAGPGGAGGACTNALVGCLHQQPRMTFVELLEAMRVTLKRKGFKQVPQLSSSLPVNLAQQFSLDSLLSADDPDCGPAVPTGGKGGYSSAGKGAGQPGPPGGAAWFGQQQQQPPPQQRPPQQRPPQQRPPQQQWPPQQQGAGPWFGQQQPQAQPQRPPQRPPQQWPPPQQQPPPPQPVHRPPQRPPQQQWPPQQQQQQPQPHPHQHHQPQQRPPRWPPQQQQQHQSHGSPPHHRPPQQTGWYGAQQPQQQAGQPASWANPAAAWGLSDPEV